MSNKDTVTVWDPYILKLIDDIESVQRRANVQF